MSEPELRKAIRQDFAAEADKLVRLANTAERTTVLQLPVFDLVPGSGPALISYILGYKTRKLIHINITVVSDGKSKQRDLAIVATANTLRDYLQREYANLKDTIVNRKVGADGFIVFRGADEAGHTVALMLGGAGAPGSHLTLTLSYASDTERPDIFRIEPGQF